MKYRHNTRQNQPIVNVTDDTSDAIRSSTLAQPVCTAADSLTANRGRGTMNARRSIKGRWCSMAILIAFAAVMLAAAITPALASVTLTCDCGDICVNTSGWWRDGGVFNASGTPIQAAIDGATAGETICVGAGSYTENVDIATAHLTLQGEGADVVTVTAADSDDSVFVVTADYVNISGFNATGAAMTDDGIYLNRADHCNIYENAASNNGFGICLYSSSNNTLVNNTAESNNWCGIYLRSSSNNNTLANNNARSNDYDASSNDYGIYLQSSSNNTLANNNASSNDYGICLQSSSNNTLANNNASSNDYGIYLYGSSSNTLTGNTANSNTLNGTYLGSSSDYNTLANNTVSNTDYGICLYSSSNNQIYNNHFNNIQNTYDDGYNIWNITPTTGTNIISGSWLGGNYWSDYTGADTTGDGLGDTLTPYNSGISNGGDYHPLVQAAATYIPPYPTTLANTTGNYWVNYTWQAGTGNVTDSYNVNMNGTWTNGTTATFLNTSVGSGGWANITVWAWNASGTGTLSAGCVSDEVQAPSAPAPALNCTCGDICVNTSGWWRGGGVLNSSGTPIQAAVDAASSGETIYVWNGSYTENVNVDKQLTLQGEGADVVNVTNSTADHHVFEVAADYVNISGFNVTGATGSWATGSWKAGIYLSSADHCNISDNNASGNYHGILLSSSSYSTLTGNNVSNNSRGIFLNSSSNNTLTSNNVLNNSDGICLWSSSYNTLLNNNADSNNDYGIGLSSSSYNTLLNNNADSNNGAGIWLGDSSYNTLLNNNADSNDFTGIYLYSSSNNALASNNANSNTDYGICLYSSSNNQIYNNHFNNIQNAYDDGNNIWNTTPIAGTNIIGGSWLGGNYWSDYAGADMNGDGLGDTLTPYNSGISSGGDYHPLVQAAAIYTPPDPTTLINTTGDFWVNHTWQAGTGNVTDSYNVNMNGTWTNGSTATFLNTSVGSGGWANITVWAWNASGTGTLSAGCGGDNVQAPSAPAPALNCTCGDICVNTSGWWRDGGVLNASGTPIQAAVDGAAAGETICVGAGSYTENVNVNKQLTLRGEGADVVTVTAADSDYSVFVVTADYVNISGFNVTGTTGSENAGIYLGSNNHCNISNNTASNNSHGIYLQSSSNNTLTSNTANSNNNYGIFLYSSSNNTLTSNTANSNSCGIILYSSSNTLTSNTANSNNNCGIWLYDSSYNTLLNNIADSNNNCGIFLYSSSNYNTLANNIADSNSYGIFLYSSSNNTLTSNTANSNNNYGIYLNSSSNNQIYNNHFNNIQNAYDDGYNIWNTTPTAGTNIVGGSWIGGNHWSDYTGADTNGDGLGDILTPYNSGIANGGDYHPLVQAAAMYTPPDPTNLANTTGDYWVNYTWSPGMGNVTDSYNVNLNGVWTNETADVFVNVTVGPSGWANITVLAYNASGTGTLSEGSVSDSVQAPAGPLTTIYIEDVAIRQGENITVPITVFDVVNMGGCEINFTYNPAVVYVTDIARGDLNFSFEYNINNGSGWMRANALDVYGQSGDVTFAYLTLAAVGNKSDVSEMEFEDSRLLDTSFGEITHIRDNGTFSILPNVLPEVTNVSRTPATILYDNGRPRTPGTNISLLSAQVTDADGDITAVTIDLSSIGGSPAQPMEPVSGDLWEVTITATEVDINAPDFTHQLAITATDDDGGINDSASIELTVLKRGDVNGDGLVDKADADYISRYLAGLEPEASNPPGVLVGDVIGDAGDPVGNGVVDLMDALYIAKYTSGMVEEP